MPFQRATSRQSRLLRKAMPYSVSPGCTTWDGPLEDVDGAGRCVVYPGRGAGSSRTTVVLAQAASSSAMASTAGPRRGPSG